MKFGSFPSKSLWTIGTLDPVTSDHRMIRTSNSPFSDPHQDVPTLTLHWCDGCSFTPGMICLGRTLTESPVVLEGPSHSLTVTGRSPVRKQTSFSSSPVSKDPYLRGAFWLRFAGVSFSRNLWTVRVTYCDTSFVWKGRFEREDRGRVSWTLTV